MSRNTKFNIFCLFFSNFLPSNSDVFIISFLPFILEFLSRFKLPKRGIASSFRKAFFFLKKIEMAVTCCFPKKSYQFSPFYEGFIWGEDEKGRNVKETSAKWTRK